MSRLRRTVRDHLERGEFDPVLALAGAEPGLMRTLVSLLYDPDELLRWRAVSAIGRVARAHSELVRPLVTRLLWTLNDESGGIGWTSAPALGEIGRNAPVLLKDGVRVVVRYLKDPTLLPGVLWAIGRLAPAYPSETREVVPQVAALCSSDDPVVRAHAAFALGEVGDARARAALVRLDADEAAAPVYIEGMLVLKDVRDWAGESLAKIRAA